MTLLGDTVRVCPQCGSDPGQDDVCRTCARDLAGLPELPTRSEWLAQPQARSSRRRAARKSVSSGVPPSLRPMLHPTEMSRLILALAVATLTLAVVLFAAIAAHAASVLPLLGGLLFFIVFLAASLWFGQQLLRARLLGQSVKVGADSLPQIHELIEEVKATLHYRRRVDVYVSDKQETPIITTSYLGTRTLILEGDFIAGLLEADKRPQLVFLIGRAIGALRAKHLRLSFVVLLLQGLDILKFPAPFILPWYRAITYSGDQIGMMCCATRRRRWRPPGGCSSARSWPRRCRPGRSFRRSASCAGTSCRGSSSSSRRSRTRPTVTRTSCASSATTTMSCGSGCAW